MIGIRYGSVVPVSTRDPTKFQHQGFGTLLMQEAERIAREEHGSTKIAVISGRFLNNASSINSFLFYLGKFDFYHIGKVDAESSVIYVFVYFEFSVIFYFTNSFLC